MENNKIKEKIAILVIDMQNVFVDHLRAGAKERIIPKQIEVIKKGIENNIPIYLIQLKNENFPKDIMSLNSEIKKSLEQNSQTIFIYKDKDNAFTGTPLEEKLLDKNINYLLLMGVNAQGCVLDTAKTAIEKGFKIITDSSLIAGQPTDSADDCAGWYSDNGVFFDNNLEGLFKYIKLTL